MVKLVDLDEEFGKRHDDYREPQHCAVALEQDERPNPNYTLSFAAALSCYP